MIAMTMMVRDEADIVGAMVRHHLDQGIDLFLVTDNGSVDGTAEILEDFARAGRIELSHDPRHLKQQHEVVTRMSREAAERGATWVLNADADEFWVARDPSRTIREELATIDPAIGAFPVPVVDMTGPPAQRGTGLQRLLYRDERPVEVMRELGVHSHATPDVAFVAADDVVVAQGNHFVNVEAKGELPPGAGLMVYHFPWRSWSQFERKVENAGRAYDASPHLRPSANHHGMRDYRRWQDGFLIGSYLARHPSPAELDEGIARGWFVLDRRIADVVPSTEADVAYPDEIVAAERDLMKRARPLERRIETLEQERRKASDDLDFERRHVAELDELVARLRSEVDSERHRADAMADELATSRAIRSRWPVRAAERATTVLDRVRRRLFTRA